MNLRRCFALLLSVLVFSLTIFSNLCYAAEVATGSNYAVMPLMLEEDTSIKLQHYIYNIKGHVNSLGYSTYVNTPFTYYNSVTVPFENDDYRIRDAIVLTADGNIMFYKGESVTFSISNIPNYFIYNGNYYNISNTSGIKINQVSGTDMSGTVLGDYTESATVKRSITIDDSGHSLVNLEVTIPYIEQDTPRIILWLETNATENYGNFTGATAIQRYYGFINSVFEYESKEANEDNSGFFASILQWLSNIREGITDTVDNIKNGFSDLGSKLSSVVNSIIQLPAKIWEKIETGLKNLFIPSEKDITDMKDKWDTLLADRFGAVYESGTLITEFAGNFTEQGTQDTITMPAVTVDLAGTDFTFGGYDVDIVPDGFGFLVEILKGVIDIVCTIAFVNSMKEKYDRLVSQ